MIASSSGGPTARPGCSSVPSHLGPNPLAPAPDKVPAKFLRPKYCINTQVDYEVQVLLEAGKVSPRHIRAARTFRGSLCIAQEHDATRHRTVLVARLRTPMGSRLVPPLYDVTIVGAAGAVWTFSGYERAETDTLQPQFFGQAWIVEPASVQDLIDAERKWSMSAGRVHQLEQQLRALGVEPVAPS